VAACFLEIEVSESGKKHTGRPALWQKKSSQKNHYSRLFIYCCVRGSEKRSKTRYFHDFVLSVSPTIGSPTPSVFLPQNSQIASARGQ
jgi:hypothetical protein